MGIVTEQFDAFPFTDPPRVMKRDESSLLSRAVPAMPGVSWDPIPPLFIARFDQAYEEGAFVPPRILWEGETGRIEWMQMNFRQPMYHRNLDVDELAYQIRGGRTLVTELGTVELDDGDFVRIPVGVAHDNWGRKESHILWYFPAPIADVGDVVRTSEVLIPPWDGWTSATVNEVHTDCLGARHCDRAVQLSDETLLLEQAESETERLRVMSPEVAPNTTAWIWTGPAHAVGLTDVTDSDGRTYTRHRNVDEVQYQVSGTRLLISANGVVEMTPGTFTHIPVGVAYASIASGSSRHITTVTTGKLQCVWQGASQSTRWDSAEIDSYRERAGAVLAGVTVPDDVVSRVVDACAALAVAGQQDMVWGHCAVPDPDRRGVWMKRAGIGFDEVTADDVILVGEDGTVVSGRGRAHVEAFIHLAIARARPDLAMTVHTHAAAVNAFTALDRPLRAISHEGVLFAEPQIPRSPLSGDLISDAERGAALAAALGDAPACLMPRHGLVTAGSSDAAAVMHAVLLEAACRVQLMAEAAGKIRSWSDGDEVRAKREHVWPPSQIASGYAYLVRKARAGSTV